MPAQSRPGPGAAARSIARLVAVTVAVGALLGAVVKAVFWGIAEAVDLVWVELPDWLGVDPTGVGYTAAALGVGALGVGLGQRILGGYPQPLEEVRDELQAGAGVPLRVLPATVANTLAALAFGGPLGPESSAVTVLAVTYTWTSGAFDQAVGYARTTLAGEGAEASRAWRYGPALVTGVVALAALFVLPGAGLQASDIPDYTRSGNGSDVLAALVAGVAGALVGLAFRSVERRVRAVSLAERAPLPAAFLGAAAVWLAALPTTLVLFSGQEEMSALFDGSVGEGEMLYSAGAKWLLLVVMFATGWKGGPAFPLMYVSAALGVGVASLASLEEVVLFAGAVAGAMTGAFRSPLLGIAIALLVVPSSMALLLVAGAAGGYVVLAAVQAQGRATGAASA